MGSRNLETLPNSILLVALPRRTFWEGDLDRNVGTRRWLWKDFFFTPKIGKDSHFDSYFSDGLKPISSDQAFILASR